jgi:hypothetical protein
MTNAFPRPQAQDLSNTDFENPVPKRLGNAEVGVPTVPVLMSARR